MKDSSEEETTDDDEDSEDDEQWNSEDAENEKFVLALNYFHLKCADWSELSRR